MSRIKKKSTKVSDDESSEDSLTVDVVEPDKFVFGGPPAIKKPDTSLRDSILGKTSSSSSTTTKIKKSTDVKRVTEVRKPTEAKKATDVRKAEVRVSDGRRRKPTKATPAAVVPNIIGKGAYGSVHVAPDGLAVKKFTHPASFVQEAVALRFLEDEDNIVRWESIDTKNLQIGMKRYSSNMRDAVRSSSVGTNARVKYLLDVLQGLHVLYNNDLVHADIKMGNILVSRGRAYIGDLGFISRTGYSRVRRTTHNARDPEPTNSYVHDIFSVGCLICKLFGGKSVRRVDQEDGSSEHITQEEFEESARSIRNKLYREVALECMDRDKSKRPTPADLIVRLGGVVKPVKIQQLPTISSESPHAEEMRKWGCHFISKGCKCLNAILKKKRHEDPEPYRDAVIFILLSCFSTGDEIGKFNMSVLVHDVLNEIIFDDAVKYILSR